MEKKSGYDFNSRFKCLGVLMLYLVSCWSVSYLKQKLNLKCIISATHLTIVISEDENLILESEQLISHSFDSMEINVKIHQYGVSQIGPIGQKLMDISKKLTRKEVIAWSGPSGCSQAPENVKKSTLKCLPGRVVF